jgi:hypothetical protein
LLCILRLMAASVRSTLRLVLRVWVGSASSHDRSAVVRATSPAGTGRGQLYLQDRSATPRQADRLSDRDVADTVNSTLTLVGPQTLQSSRSTVYERFRLRPCANAKTKWPRDTNHDRLEALESRADRGRLLGLRPHL